MMRHIVLWIISCPCMWFLNSLQKLISYSYYLDFTVHLNKIYTMTYIELINAKGPPSYKFELYH